MNKFKILPYVFINRFQNFKARNLIYYPNQKFLTNIQKSLKSKEIKINNC